MGVFNRNQLRKRTFTATVVDSEVMKDFKYRGHDEIPAQAAIKLLLKTTTGKESPQEWPIGDAKNFKFVDEKTIRPKGDHAISEQSGGGLLIAALDKLGVALDDTTEPLEGMTFRWGQEIVPGRKGTTLLPSELVGQTDTESDESEEEEEAEEEEAEEAEKEKHERPPREEETEEEEAEEEEAAADDAEALATMAIVSVLKAKKKIGLARVGIEVHKSAVLRGVSNSTRMAASKLAGTSKFQKAKGQPWAIKGDYLVPA